MQITNEESTALNHLIEVCRDGQDGFETASEAIGDKVLQSELNQYSLQRMDFAVDLEAALRSMGQPAHDGGSVAGALHRGWMNLKAAVASNDEYAVLSECERGEDSAVRAYREAIEAHLAPEVETLVEQQYHQVQRVHDRMKQLRDAARPN
jgi:uncharacterized protein (TIGR02284 family)